MSVLAYQRTEGHLVEVLGVVQTESASEPKNLSFKQCRCCRRVHSNTLIKFIVNAPLIHPASPAVL